MLYLRNLVGETTITQIVMCGSLSPMFMSAMKCYWGPEKKFGMKGKVIPQKGITEEKVPYSTLED